MGNFPKVKLIYHTAPYLVMAVSHFLYLVMAVSHFLGILVKFGNTPEPHLGHLYVCVAWEGLFIYVLLSAFPVFCDQLIGIFGT